MLASWAAEPGTLSAVTRLLPEPMGGTFANAAVSGTVGAAGVYLLTVGKKDDSARKMALGAALIIGAMFLF